MERVLSPSRASEKCRDVAQSLWAAGKARTASRGANQRGSPSAVCKMCSEGARRCCSCESETSVILFLQVFKNKTIYSHKFGTFLRGSCLTIYIYTLLFYLNVFKLKTKTKKQFTHFSHPQPLATTHLFYELTCCFPPLKHPTYRRNLMVCVLLCLTHFT